MKRILINFGRPRGRSQRYTAALSLARTFDAEIRCSFEVPPVSLVAPRTGMILSESDVEARLNEPRRMLEEAQAEYETLSFQCGVATYWESHWKSEERDNHQLARLRGCYADLVITEVPGEDGLSDRDVFDIVERAASAVMVLPDDLAQNHAFATVMVAWNGSQQAARALHESLPLLKRATRVIVASADEGDLPSPDSAPGDRLLDYLSQHQIEAETSTLEARPEDMGSALLQHAAEQQAGLVVMGAFGHSRTFEYWLGGATRDVLEQTSIPLLMAH